MKKHLLAILLVLGLSYWAIRPFLTSGYFPMHDDTQVGRVVAMGKALRNGQFPVRWVSDLGYGYGYPIFNFYGPLPYYFGGFLYALGFSGLVATKIMSVAGIVLSGVAMYFLATEFFGLAGGLLAAIFYIYAPYHAVQIYVRGAIGESWVLIFLPLLLLGLYKSNRQFGRGILLGGIGLAGTILSHTLLGYVVTSFTILGILIQIIVGLIKKQNLKLFLGESLVVFVGLGLSAFFWLPAILEMNFTNVAAQVSSTANFHDHFVCVNQFWDSPWGFGGSVSGCADGLSFKLGKIQIIVAIIALGIWSWKLRREQKFKVVVVISMITLIAVFLSLQLSQWFWEVLPGFSYLQYPWRFITIAIFGLSFIGGLITFVSVKQAIQILISTCLIFLIILVNGKLFMPQYIYPKSDSEFETEAELRFRVSKISDEYLPPGIYKPKNVSEIVHDTITQADDLNIETEVDTETYAKFIIKSANNRIITIKRAYFPGWQYWVNGKQTIPTVTNGLPSLGLPAGIDVVEMRFGNTLPRLLGNVFSILTIIVLFIYYGKKKVT